MNKKEEQNYYWKLFSKNDLPLKNLDSSNFIQEDSVILLSKSDYKADMQLLKSHLTPEGYKTVNNRYRQFKHKKSNNTTTITLKEPTLKKLKSMGIKAGISDDYDLLLEYLLDPSENLQEAKLAIQNLETGLKPSQIFTLIVKRFPSLTKWVKAISELSFNAGWTASSTTRGKKTKAIYEKALSEFKSDLDRL